ncbi:DUF6493 family protein [Streptomyces sp. NPDC005423]|uniref:DUF7825 domain-containing protein n=1 Tax=Streptomyces sp. NPDC005423 TaxID=3155343 RepID=UPI0033B9D526
MSSLTDAVRAGRTAEVVSLLDELTDAERRSLFPELKALRKELRTAPWDARSRRAYPALHAAGVACQTGAAAVAAWLAAPELRWSPASPGVLLHLLGDRDADWLADVTHRLAGRPPSADVPYELMAGLVRLAGCPVPTTDAYVTGWMRHIAQVWQVGGTLTDRLRRDPHLGELVAALFETDDVGGLLGRSAAEGPDSWIGALAQLTAEGALDRERTVDACVARLLRGGAASDQRVFLPLLGALSLTRDEEREHTTDWLALASDGGSVVASYAQSVLGKLALDGGLTARQLAEMSRGVLFRPERKLVRAQLILLGKALSGDAATAGELLPAVGQAFGHEDSEVQERAVKLVERHIGKTGSPEVRAELAELAAQLVPGLRVRVAATLGSAVADAGPAVYEELLPPVPEPSRLSPAPTSVFEVAEEVGALEASPADVAAYERTLDGLVRHAYRDRDGVARALRPVLARRWWSDARYDRARKDDFFGRTPLTLDLVLATVAGEVSTAVLHTLAVRGPRGSACVHGALLDPMAARLAEVAYRIRTDPLPCLLATPTWRTGLLDPAELVDRLAEFARLGARVPAADFAQALLRVGREDRGAAVAAAERASALGTPEGFWLAEWLTKDPVRPPAPRRTAGPRILVEFGESAEPGAAFPAGFRRLGAAITAPEGRWQCYHWDATVRHHWLAVLPENREAVAARILRDVSTAALDDTRGVTAALPSLAESGGPAGDATHLCVAYGLGARHPEDRLAAVDALLVLAARGQLDGARLGGDLAQLVRGGAVKPSRLAESVRTAASTGANATLWEILRHTLPVLLGDLATEETAAPARGLGELLAVAAECAERCGARGELPHLARTAGRRGSSRLVAQARRLRSALTEGVAA